MEIAMNLGCVDPVRFNDLYELTREIERMLSSLVKKVTSST
jgi:hypothetical protein